MNRLHDGRPPVSWRKVLAAATAGLVLTVAVAGGTASAGSPAPPRSTTLQQGLDDLHGLGITGAQGLMRNGDRVIRARSGVADLTTGAPMPMDGYFRMGSDTKTFVSVVLLQLVGEGRIGLDDTVERWLPGVVTGNGNDGRRITVRQLLQHTSGLANYTEDLPVLASSDGYRAHRFDHYDAAALVALAMAHPPKFVAGTHWDYSNTNFILAGMIVERVTGRPWSAEVRSRILVPLGMRQSSYPADRPTLPQPHAEGYQQFAPGAALEDTTEFNTTVAGAAGGMVTTTTDLARFWQALQRGQLLHPRQMAQLHDTVLAETVQDILPGARYGLGIMWIQNRCGGYWAHFGDVPGTSTLNAVTPDGTRALVFYETTGLAGPAAATVEHRNYQLIDDLICG